MRAVILGAGAIGRWLGANLARSGADTVLVVRPSRVSEVASGIATPEGLVPVRLVDDLAALAEEDRRCDWLVLTVKAFDAAEAAAQAARAGLDPRRVLAVQNGLGTDEAVASAFGAGRTFVGSVTRAVALTAEGGIQPAARGGFALAPMQAGADGGDLLDRLAGQGLPTARHEDWRGVKWSKLLLNMVANAACAVLDMPPDEVLRRPSLYALEIRAMREALRAMRRLGAPVVDLPDYPVRLLARAARSLPTWFSYPLAARRMARGRGHKAPSLLLDLRAGRRRTEVGFLNGAVPGAGVEAPVNSFLARTVEGIASGEIPWDRFRGRPEALTAALRRGGPVGAVEGPAP